MITGSVSSFLVGLVSSATMTVVSRSKKSNFPLQLFLELLSQQFCWHPCCMRLATYHFCIDSGLGGCFSLIINIFIKKVFLSFVITFGVTNYIVIISIILMNLCNSSDIIIIIQPLITCRTKTSFSTLI